MAAVTYSDGTIREFISGEAKMVIWVSPSTMDSADTVTPTAITGKTIRVHSAWDHTTGDAITATISSGVITLDAAGGTTNHEYSVVFSYI
jgi:hypothetical protein